jgi:hypothetical protein
VRVLIGATTTLTERVQHDPHAPRGGNDPRAESSKATSRGQRVRRTCQQLSRRCSRELRSSAPCDACCLTLVSAPVRSFSTTSRAAAPPPGVRARRRPPVATLAGEERGRALRAGAAPPSSACARLTEQAPAAPYRPRWAPALTAGAVSGKVLPTILGPPERITQYAIYVAGRNDRTVTAGSATVPAHPDPQTLLLINK